jgi:hypothetical protein
MPEYTNYNEYLQNMGLILKDGASILCLSPGVDATRPGPFCEDRVSPRRLHERGPRAWSDLSWAASTTARPSQTVAPAT